MFNSTSTLDSKVRESEIFPRIRDAEKLMRENEIKMKDKYDPDPIKVGKSKIKKQKKIKTKIEDLGPFKPKKELDTTSFFSTFVINDDPEVAKFIEFSEIQFPNMYNPNVKNLDPGSIDKLWMSGFLDRAERDKDIIKKQQEKAALDSISTPDLGISETSSIVQKDNLSTKKNKNNLDLKDKLLLGNSSSSSSNKTKVNRNVVEADYDDLESMPMKQKHTKFQRGDDDSTVEALSTGFSYLETSQTLSMDESVGSFSDKLKRAAEQKKEQASLASIQTKNKNKEKIILKSMEPYIAEIKAVKLRKKKVVVPTDGDKFISTDLEKLFDLERREHIAAATIQKIYRLSKRLGKWQWPILCNKMAVKIQRVIRGSMTRKFVARWFLTRNAVVINWQAGVRKVLSNKHIKPVLAKEYAAATTIQKIVRAKLGRKKLYNLKVHIAATHIQQLWRGIVSRTRADKLWLDRVVIPMQKYVRRMVAAKSFKEEKRQLDAAALLIQKRFRTWISSTKLSKALYNREMDYRINVIAVLTSEEEFVQEKLEKMTKRILNRGLRENAEHATKKLHDKMDLIRQKENDLVEITRQREILSPRALRQGWVTELDANIHELRAKVTDLKLEEIFVDSTLMHEIDHNLEEKILEIEKMAAYRDRLSHWRDQEYAERREKTYWRDIKEMRKRDRMNVAYERRKWQVLFYTSDGKPDKKRRPGKEWDPSVYAGAEKMVYSGGNGVNLMSHIKNGEILKPGTNESVEKSINNLALQTYLEEVNHYEQLLNPITDILAKTMGGPPKHAQPEDLGWGEEGKKLAPALLGIGAVPQRWERPLSPGGTTFAIIDNAADKKTFSDRRLEKLRLLSPELGVVRVSNSAQGNKHEKFKNDPSFDSEELKFLLKLKEQDDKKFMNNARSMEIDAAIAEEVAKQKEKHLLRRKNRKRANKKIGASIPWALLDELNTKRKLFENEKAHVEFNNTF